MEDSLETSRAIERLLILWLLTVMVLLFLEVCLSPNFVCIYLYDSGDDGSMLMWDWKTGHCFQKLQTIVQPGSLESEAGIFCTQFDQTGCRLITCEADKSIKIWKEIEDAVGTTVMDSQAC